MRDPARFVQIHNRDGRTHFEALPYTAEEPTPAQIEARAVFSEAAKGAAGQRREPGDLPPAAVAVRRQMLGFGSPLTKADPEPKWQTRLRDWRLQQGATRRQAEDEVASVVAFLRRGPR